MICHYALLSPKARRDNVKILFKLYLFGFMKLSTSQVMEDQDPVSWDIAQGEYIDGLVQDEELISFDNENTYFWKHDVENYIEEVELEMEEAA